MNNTPPPNAVPALTSTPEAAPSLNRTLMNLNSQIQIALSKISLLPQFRGNVGLNSIQNIEKLVYPDLSGFTPLHYVAAMDEFNLAVDLVFIFRQLGQNQFLTILDKQGRTPLHWAVSSGSFRMVKLLIENGASLNNQDYDGATPIHTAIAASAKFRETEKLEEFKEIINYLGDRADINQTDIEGVSPLHLAAELGDVESIRGLIEKGAWINIQDHQGENALFYAVRGEHTEVIKALVEDYNIDMQMLNEDDENILDLCKSIGNDELLEMITSLYNARVKVDCRLKETTNGIKWSGQRVELLSSNSGSIRFSGHSCA